MSYTFQFREYAQALYEALKEDAYYIAIEKSIDNQDLAKEGMYKYFDYSICESQKYGEVFIPENEKFGLSVWSNPISNELSAEKSKAKKEFLLNELGEKTLETYNQITSFMSEKADELIHQDSWYLSIVGILPSFQNQGLGSSLIHPVLEQTDKLGIETYLETFTPRNKSFYERLGYTDVAIYLEPITQEEYSIMKRVPKIS